MEKTVDDGKYISLASHLKPQGVIYEHTKPQSELLELWVRDQEERRVRAETIARWTSGLGAADKKQSKEDTRRTFVLGSKEPVHFCRDAGFFSTILAAYNYHWELKTCPDDWWMTISQKIAMAIDKNAQDPSVRQLFVSHEGKKTLTVEVGPSIHGVDYEWFFQQMTGQISKSINNPDYTQIMEADFSSSTPVQKIVNQIMLMYSFQQYFEYRMMTLCGIPGVVMLGSQDDWSLLIQKLEKVETFLKPIEHVLGLDDWFKSCKAVLEKLLDTFNGNPDTDWWSRIMTIDVQHGSGGGTYYNGWFVRDFMGLRSDKLQIFDVPSGINVVPLTIAEPSGYSEEASLAAGVTGYKVTEAENKDRFPSVQAVQGWGLLLDPASPFR